MKTDPLFNLKQKNRLSREKKVTLGLIITGILSFLVVLVTIYGQFTGTFLIKLTSAAERKGILLATDHGFESETEKLVLNPISNVEDILESNIVRIEEILASEGGQYEDPDGNNYYIAYTFFVKNSGREVIDVRYDLTLLRQHKRLGEALAVIMYIDNLDGTPPEKEIYYKKEGSNLLGAKRFENFEVDEVKKITIITFIDGHRSNPEMLGGAVKIQLVFTVETADE
ncbi:MAG: hypothetical protein GX931_06000 [Acholeplasmataceae bacterium]|nr:hypothetical protein [Acholeplasmataceae bacterium]